MLSRSSSFSHDETSPIQLHISDLATGVMQNEKTPLKCAQGSNLSVTFKHARTSCGSQTRVMILEENLTLAAMVPLEILGRETQQQMSLQHDRGFLPNIDQYSIIALVQGLTVFVRFNADNGMKGVVRMTLTSTTDFTTAVEQFRRYGCPMKEKIEPRPSSRSSLHSAGNINLQSSPLWASVGQAIPDNAISFNTLSSSSFSQDLQTTSPSIDLRQGALNSSFRLVNYGVRPPSSNRPASPLRQVQNSTTQDSARETIGTPSSSLASSPQTANSFNPMKSLSDQSIFNFSQYQNQTNRSDSTFQKHDPSKRGSQLDTRPSTSPFVQRSPFFPTLVNQPSNADSERPNSSQSSRFPQIRASGSLRVSDTFGTSLVNSAISENPIEDQDSPNLSAEPQPLKRKANRPAAASKRARAAGGGASVISMENQTQEEDVHDAPEPTPKATRAKSRARPVSRAKGSKASGSVNGVDVNDNSSHVGQSAPIASVNPIEPSITEFVPSSAEPVINTTSPTTKRYATEISMPPISQPLTPTCEANLIPATSRSRSPLSEIREAESAQNALFFAQTVDVQEAAIEESIIDALGNPDFPALLDRVKGIWRRIGFEGWTDTG